MLPENVEYLVNRVLIPFLLGVAAGRIARWIRDEWF